MEPLEPLERLKPAASSNVLNGAQRLNHLNALTISVGPARGAGRFQHRNRNEVAGATVTD